MKGKAKILVIGQHPVRRHIISQYERKGAEIVLAGAIGDDVEAIEAFDEIVALTSPSADDPIGEDGRMIEWLRQIAPRLTSRPIVHVLLQSPTTLRILQQMDLPDGINNAMEAYPFTMEDTWAKELLVHLPGIKPERLYPSLERDAVIDSASQSTVHLVIAGFDSYAQAVATHAALVAHFPNYNGKDEQPLRTRITIIDNGIRERRDNFIAAYRTLFDNSFYRTIDIGESTCSLHKPMYAGQREDFVDVEWEFVEGSINHPYMVDKIGRWAADENKLLTIVLSSGNDETDLSRSITLPDAVYTNKERVAVFVRQTRDIVTEPLGRSPRLGNVHVFGMIDRGYDTSIPLISMAKYLNYFYWYYYDEKHPSLIPTVIPYDEVEREWHELKSYKMRLSNVFNVMTMTTKMHSLGHNEEDYSTFYALTRDESILLARTEHNRWSVERLITGNRPCTDAEQELICDNIDAIIAAPTQEDKAKLPKLKKKYANSGIHYDLRAFDDLRVDNSNRNVQLIDIALTECIPLIVKSYTDKNSEP